MLIFNPIRPWSYIAAAVVLLAALLVLARGVVDFIKGRPWWQNLGGNKITRFIVLGLTLLASILLAAAAMNPFWTRKPGISGFHLQLAVDVSESVLRANGGWDRVRKDTYEKIKAGISSMRGDLRDKSTAGILTFRTDTNTAMKKGLLKNLPGTFLQLDRDSFASGGGTDIETGLNKAAALLNKAGGQGAVLLISDGNQTEGDGLAAARELARQGVPVHILPVTSRSPAVAITDADLPRQVYTNVRTYVRGLMLNRLPGNKEAGLALTTYKGAANAAEDDPADERLTSEKQVSLPAGRWVRFRWPVVFDDFGIQFIDLSLAAEGTEKRNAHRRRFFTYVKRPAQILAIGGDNRWMEAIPGDVAEVIPVPPNEVVDDSRLKDIDAVVINSVPSFQLEAITTAAVAEAVENRGVGLFLINGGHIDADDEAETVIMSYKKTPLGALLPVDGGPRPFADEPPSRDVAILIDTSGSMAGWKIDKTKEIAAYIVRNLLRPQDRLDLITFTTGAGHLIRGQFMDEAGKEEALRRIASIRAWGGTDPRRALALIGNRQLAECGLIFLSDGEFHYVGYRPDCRTTVFEIGSSRYSRSMALQQLADPIPVNRGFDPQAITIPYFKPKERLKFFERGVFTPLSMEDYLPKNQRVPVPPLDIEGSAVSHLKEGAILNGVRPKLTDPVLAFGEGGAGYAGVFTSEIPREWIRLNEGRQAIREWIARLIPFMDRDRYDFKLEDYGDAIDIRISLSARSGNIPNVTRMNANIYFTGKEKEAVGIALRADDTAPGTFLGQIRVNRTSHARRAILSVREFGPDALPRDQRIPVMIPPRGRVERSTTAEAYTYGQNRELLKKIADAGGGLFDPPKGVPFFKEKPAPGQGSPLWPFPAAAAVLCYLGAITLKRWEP